VAEKTRPWPWRLIVRGAFQDGWSLADQGEKDQVFREWIEIHKEWQALGCKLIATVDDELSMVGQPGGRLWNFYSLWEIPEPGIVYDLLNFFRTEEEGRLRLDKYFRFETLVGKPIVSMEKALLGGIPGAAETE
jgi:hypothetical protein